MDGYVQWCCPSRIEPVVQTQNFLVQYSLVELVSMKFIYSIYICISYFRFHLCHTHTIERVHLVKNDKTKNPQNFVVVDLVPNTTPQYSVRKAK